MSADRDAANRHRAMQTIRRIAREERCSVDDIFGHARHPDTDRARRRAMAVLRWSTQWSYPEIGRVFGRDHTTVLHAVRRYEEELNP